MGTKTLIFSLVTLVFLMAIIPGQLKGAESATGFPRTGKQISRNLDDVYIKSNEEIAYELFLYALTNIGELKFINTYEEYLEAYKKALKAVYSSGN